MLDVCPRPLAFPSMWGHIAQGGLLRFDGPPSGELGSLREYEKPQYKPAKIMITSSFCGTRI